MSTLSSLKGFINKLSKSNEVEADHIQSAVNNICGVDDYDDTIYDEDEVVPKTELLIAKMAMHHCGLRLQVSIESIEEAIKLISDEVSRASQTASGDYNPISYDVHDIIDGTISLLRDELIERVYEYDSCLDDLEMAEWVTPHRFNKADRSA